MGVARVRFGVGTCRAFVIVGLILLAGCDDQQTSAELESFARQVPLPPASHVWRVINYEAGTGGIGSIASSEINAHAVPYRVGVCDEELAILKRARWLITWDHDASGNPRHLGEYESKRWPFNSRFSAGLTISWAKKVSANVESSTEPKAIVECDPTSAELTMVKSAWKR